MPGARLPARRRAVSRWIAAVVAGIALIAGPLVAVPTAVAAPVTYAKSAHVPTADLTKFQPGNIISDATFFDRGTMTEAQIQSFLEARVPNCQSGYTCLKDWYDTSRTTTADAMCGAYSGGVRERASRIIYKVAQACGINPQVILATLEKEQGLVRHTWPSEWRYTIAMGQGCPDTAACDTRYYGFFNQVYGAAWQFKRYANPAGTSQYFTWYAPGKTWNVRYNPNASCGSSPVYIQNQATANLYYYTPYQPNAAALRAGYGTGDGCSAYGNRNFYNFFTDWFGSTQGNGVPEGRVTSIESVANGARVAGTAAVPGMADAVKIQVYVNNVWARTVLARNGSFSATIPLEIGSRRVCLVAENPLTGARKDLACKWLTVYPGGVFGELQDVQPGEERVVLQGWALDPRTWGAVKIHVQLDNRWNRTVFANRAEPSVAARFPGLAVSHGFEAVVTTAPGTRKVCASAEAADGTVVSLGCQGVDVVGLAPVGSVTAIEAVPNGVRVQGTATVPPRGVPAKVHVFVGNVWQRTLQPMADGRFEATIATEIGSRRVCLVAENPTGQARTDLGCRWLTVLPAGIFGGYDSIASMPGVVRATGWAIDPVGEGPAKIQVLVNNVWFRSIAAAQPRADVAARFPGLPSGTGFSIDVPAGPTSTKVCFVGEGRAAGDRVDLGCQWAAAQTGNPFGWINEMSPRENGVYVYGWAIDPDTTAAVKVHVMVDNVWSRTIQANRWRTDLGERYPLYGAAHAFSETIPLEPGTRKVCLIAENQGLGVNTNLGCAWLQI